MQLTEGQFEAVFVAWQPALERFAGRTIIDRLSAEEVAADALTRLWLANANKGLPTNEAHLRNLAYQCGKQAVADYHRRLGRSVPSTSLNQLVDDYRWDAVADDLLLADDPAEIEALLPRFPAGTRSIIGLLLTGQLTTAEIMTQLGISRSTYDTRLYRARQLASTWRQRTGI